MSKGRNRVVRWLSSTSNRTFVVFPVLVAAVELALRGGALQWQPLGLPLLAWGYLQYRLVGNYRFRLGRGGPGMSVPPERLVKEGPYRLVRNPMYLGHLVFMVGLAITFRSWFAVALWIFHLFWFQRRVREDEARLVQLFGDDYREYASRVKRWIPGVI